MRVKCIYNNGQSILEDSISEGYSSGTTFDLTINKDYIVLGISLYKGWLSYLIMDDYEVPVFYPVKLFKENHRKMPDQWKFRAFNEPEFLLKALWGFPKLIDDLDFYDSLVEGDAEARWVVKKEYLRLQRESEQQEIG